VSKFVVDCVDVSARPYAPSPTLLFKLRIAETTGATIHALALRSQIRIEPQRRRYNGEEADLLISLFGEPSRWGETLKPMEFAAVSTMVTSFTGSKEVDLAVSCSYDLDVAAGSYFHSLREGHIPFVLLFSGTVFGKGENGFWVEQIPWSLESQYELPVSEWTKLMDQYFPEQGWLRLQRSTLDALLKYKANNAIPTWDQTLEQLLAASGDGPDNAATDPAGEGTT
jgi:hypothetical protein